MGGSAGNTAAIRSGKRERHVGAVRPKAFVSGNPSTSGACVNRAHPEPWHGSLAVDKPGTSLPAGIVWGPASCVKLICMDGAMATVSVHDRTLSACGGEDSRIRLTNSPLSLPASQDGHARSGRHQDHSAPEGALPAPGNPFSAAGRERTVRWWEGVKRMPGPLGQNQTVKKLPQPLTGFGTGGSLQGYPPCAATGNRSRGRMAQNSGSSGSHGFSLMAGRLW